MVSRRILVVGVTSSAFVTGFSARSAAVVTAPALRANVCSQMGLQEEQHITGLAHGLQKNVSSSLAKYKQFSHKGHFDDDFMNL